jgi:hypothetical protein
MLSTLIEAAKDMPYHVHARTGAAYVYSAKI